MDKAYGGRIEVGPALSPAILPLPRAVKNRAPLAFQARHERFQALRVDSSRGGRGVLQMSQMQTEAFIF